MKYFRVNKIKARTGEHHKKPSAISSSLLCKHWNALCSVVPKSAAGPRLFHRTPTRLQLRGIWIAELALRQRTNL